MVVEIVHSKVRCSGGKVTRGGSDMVPITTKITRIVTMVEQSTDLYSHKYELKS